MKEIPEPGCYRFPSHAVRTQDGRHTWKLGPEISSLSGCDSGTIYEWDTHFSVARRDANTLIASCRNGELQYLGGR